MREWLIQFVAQGANSRGVILVRVPVAQADFDERHARLDQPSSQQAASAKIGLTVRFAHRLGLTAQIEGFHSRAEHHLRGFLVEPAMFRYFRCGRAVRGGFQVVEQPEATFVPGGVGRRLDVVGQAIGTGHGERIVVGAQQTAGACADEAGADADERGQFGVETAQLARDD